MLEQYASDGKADAMNAPHPPKVAGIDSTIPSPAHTVAPVPAKPGCLSEPPALTGLPVQQDTGTTHLAELSNGVTLVGEPRDVRRPLIRPGNDFEVFVTGLAHRVIGVGASPVSRTTRSASEEQTSNQQSRPGESAVEPDVQGTEVFRRGGPE